MALSAFDSFCRGTGRGQFPQLGNRDDLWQLLALITARKAVDLNPGYFDALNLLARTLYSMGAYQAALPVLEQAHELNPNDPDVTGVLERLRAALKSQSR